MSKRHPTWREMHMDTAPEVEVFMFNKLVEMSFAEKLERVEHLNQVGRQFLLMGLKRDFPEASENEIRQRFASAILGEALAMKAYGNDEIVEARDAY